MEVKDILKKINKNRDEIEAPFIFCLWKDPNLYDDYKSINVRGDKTIQSKDGLFYFQLGRGMYNEGYRNFDSITLDSYLKDKPKISQQFEEYGGFGEVEEMTQLVDVENVDAYYDKLAKINILSNLLVNYADTFNNLDDVAGMTSQNVYDLFEYTLNNVSLAVNHDIKVQSLVLDDAYIEECNNGEAMGLSYAENCPRLSSKTLGLPLGDLYMLGAHSGVGKSSFMFENFILPLNNQGIKVAIVSNEMQLKAYQNLILVHILTHELNYWKLTRKHLKVGHFTDEQIDLIKQAQKISEDKYSNIRFVKIFDTDTNKLLKIIKKLAKVGYQCICYDTMKADDSTADNMWQRLMIDSRRIFQLASKENISIVVTYQLALYTENQRYLSASCLSNSKQIKEVFSEMVYMRNIWHDEFPKEQYDIKPYTLEKKTDGSGWYRNYNSIKLDKNKKYIIAFLDKTRNDENNIQILYEWNARFNYWKEIGYCTVVNEHRGITR